MEAFRAKLTENGIPARAIALLESSVRETTSTTYDYAWRKWTKWCRENGQAALSDSLSTVLEFLTHLWEAGKSYSSINIHRSTLVSALYPTGEKGLSHNRTLSLFMRSIYNKRPPQPRYSSTWRVQQVLDLFTKWGENEILSLRHLTRKTVMLLALTTFFRSCEIANVTFSSIKFNSADMSFILAKPRKAQRSGSLNCFKVTKFEDSILCPVAAVKEYIKRTSDVNRARDALHFCRGRETTRSIWC